MNISSPPWKKACSKAAGRPILRSTFPLLTKSGNGLVGLKRKPPKIQINKNMIIVMVIAMPPPIASPETPLASKPTQPKVMAIPSARLKVTPTIALQSGVVLSPVARKAMLKTSVVNMAGAKTAVQSTKSIAKRCAPSERPKIPTNCSRNGIASQASSRPSMKNKNTDSAAKRPAKILLLPPQYLPTTAVVPAQSPIITACKIKYRR